jgi:hypothetical protein
MNTKENTKEVITIILASLVLALTVAFKNTEILYAAALSFLIIITINVLVKKLIGYNFEINTKTKFWTWKQFGFRKDMHFNKPLPMIWLPLLLTLFTKGFFLWLGILEFDVEAKTERVSKRHGLYRFTEVTEWHMAWIATWALATNLILAILGYIVGFELFAKLSIYFIAWSVIPLGKLDGSKILFGSRALWMIVTTVAALFLLLAMTITI